MIRDMLLEVLVGKQDILTRIFEDKEMLIGKTRKAHLARLVQSATFQEIFKSKWPMKLDAMCFPSLRSIKIFCKKYPESVSEKRNTFFLLRKDSKYVVIWVSYILGKLDFCDDNDSFESKYMRSPRNKAIIVYPVSI